MTLSEAKKLSLIDGISLAGNSNTIPNPTLLAEWCAQGFYYINFDLNVFKLTQRGKHAIKSLMEKSNEQ